MSAYRPCAGCDSVGDSCRAIGCPATTQPPVTADHAPEGLSERERQELAYMFGVRWLSPERTAAVERILTARTTALREQVAEVVRARNYAMRQRDEERAAKEGNIRALDAACTERDALREQVARVEALRDEMRRDNPQHTQWWWAERLHAALHPDPSPTQPSSGAEEGL